MFIAGLEFSKELVPFLKEGKVDMMSYYSVFDAGFLAMESAYKYLNGEQLPPFIELDVTIVTKNNVNQIKPEF